jgi:hypothetical protein
MKRKIFIAVMALIGLSSFWATAQNATALTPKESNGVFEIISYSPDSVKFKAVVETKFYSLALVSGKQTVEAQWCSNSADTVQWANGARFWPGSTMPLPASVNIGAMTLPAGIIMTVSDFSVPENFKAEKVRFITEGTTEMYYDIAAKSWISK